MLVPASLLFLSLAHLLRRSFLAVAACNFVFARFLRFFAVSCLYLLCVFARSCDLAIVPASWLVFGGCLPVISISAPFVRFGACTCFAMGFWRLPACNFRFGSVPALWCLYLLRCWFLVVGCPYFTFWLAAFAWFNTGTLVLAQFKV